MAQKAETIFRPSFSDRLPEILRLAAAGHSNKQIAGEVGLSRQTVKNGLSRYYRKIGVDNRTGAVTHALRNGYISYVEIPEN